ncbi:MAG: hypothetical protein FWE61_06765 [Micrococcales bacterium]|nr:hypothetical protein [Micrococcales bacterium]
MTNEPAPATVDHLTDDHPTGPLPVPGPPAAPPPAPARVRIGTVIWGLVLAALGVGVVAAATGHRFDLGLAAIVVLGAAGVALLVSSLVGAARR